MNKINIATIITALGTIISTIVVNGVMKLQFNQAVLVFSFLGLAIIIVMIYFLIDIIYGYKNKNNEELKKENEKLKNEIEELKKKDESNNKEIIKLKSKLELKKDISLYKDSVLNIIRILWNIPYEQEDITIENMHLIAEKVAHIYADRLEMMSDKIKNKKFLEHHKKVSENVCNHIKLETLLRIIRNHLSNRDDFKKKQWLDDTNKIILGRAEEVYNNFIDYSYLDNNEMEIINYVENDIKEKLYEKSYSTLELILNNAEIFAEIKNNSIIKAQNELKEIGIDIDLSSYLFLED